jgi:hypothetical protein
VDEDSSFAAVQLCEDGVESRISEVGAFVICFESDSIRVQSVKRIGNLSQGAVDIGEGESGPEAEFSRTAADEIAGEVVTLSRQFPCAQVIARGQIHAWRADAYDGFGD